MSEGAPEPGRGVGWLAWLSGALLLLVVILVATHAAEEREIAALLRQARPLALLVAAVLQLGTYVCAAGVWYCALNRPPHPSLRSLVPLGLAKLFTDQVAPSGGLSGTLLVVRALTHRRVARGDAVAAMLIGLAAFYYAYAIAVAVAVVALAVLGSLDRFELVLAGVLGLVAGVIPAVLLGERRLIAPARLPEWLQRIPGVRTMLGILAELPPGALWHPRMAAETIGLQLAIFVLDAATLAATLAAVGAEPSFAIAFPSFVFASVIATLAWMPGGIGTFEGSSVFLLRSHGVPIEAALAATLLLRALTFWLPMLPGLVLARRELRLPGGNQRAGTSPDTTG